MGIQPYKDFYARFLGGFSLYYRGREIMIGANLQNKPLQMLLMLLRAKAGGVERSELLALVRPREENVEKRSNNLRQHLHILRRVIARSGFPEGDYIILAGSRYYFSRTHEVETDVSYLDRLVEHIEEEVSEEERGELCSRYCRAYTGEFLPMLGGEEWVTIESAFYQKWYNTCLDDTCRRLRAEKRYGTMLELCTMASQFHPYDEWQALQIECLMAMGRYKEAMEVYGTATETFYKDLGPTSLDRVIEGCRGKDGRIHHGADILEKIKQGLEGEEAASPYYCGYPSFLDAYRIMARMGERMGTESLLLLCTVQPGPERADSLVRVRCGCRGDPDGGESEGCTGEPGAERRRYIEDRMIRLRQILTEGLRAGDVYTRYSENQYLVLLIGAGMEDGERIAARLERYQRLIDRGGRTRVRFTIEEVEGLGAGGSGDGEERDVHRACHQPGERDLAGAGDLAG